MVHKYLLNIVNFVSCFHLTDLEYWILLFGYDTLHYSFEIKCFKYML